MQSVSSSGELAPSCSLSPAVESQLLLADVVQDITVRRGPDAHRLYLWSLGCNQSIQILPAVLKYALRQAAEEGLVELVSISGAPNSEMAHEVSDVQMSGTCKMSTHNELITFKSNFFTLYLQLHFILWVHCCGTQRKNCKTKSKVHEENDNLGGVQSEDGAKGEVTAAFTWGNLCSNLLQYTTRSHTGFGTFSCFGPHIWNSLPPNLRHC